MILDSILLFGKNVSINGAASVETEMTSSLLIDAVKDQFGSSIINDVTKGGGVQFNMYIGSTQLAASSAAATMEVNFYEHSAATSTKSGNLVHQIIVQDIKKAASIESFCKIGAVLIRTTLPQDMWGTTSQKYLGISCKILGQTVDTGTVTAFLGLPDTTILP